MHINIAKSDCSGCSACANICPKNCINMYPDAEGFSYPKIDKTICINCGKCQEVCNTLHRLNRETKARAYAAYNKDESVRLKSSSGGVFTAIAEEIIDRGGVVFGAAFANDFSVQHISINKKENIEKLRGSKYLQSSIGSSYAGAKKYLEEDRIVLFSGTPCQIDGLYHYLGRDYPNLYTQDLICHGVPSPLAWKKYLEYRCKDSGKPLDFTRRPEFRSKDNGWKNYSLKTYHFNNYVYQKKIREDLYMGAFLKNICLRPSCYNCKSKSLKRNSDITLADFWGIEEIDRSMFDDKGTSLVFINTEKGTKLMQHASRKLIIKETDINKAVSYNSSAYESVKMNAARKKFVKLIQRKPFDEAFKISIRDNFGKRIKFIWSEYTEILLCKLKSIMQKMFL